MSVVRSLVFLLALFLMAVPSLALNPFDDDAGSGGDAGDDFASATAIVPGRHEGRLTQEVDQTDVYRMELQRGSYLEVDWGHDSGLGAIEVELWGPSGEGDVVLRARSPFPGGPTLYYTAPVAGTWFIAFHLRTTVLEPVAYAFDADVTQHPSLLSITSEAGSLVLEAKVERSSELFVAMRQDLIRYSTDHEGAMLGSFHWDLEWGENGTGKGYSGWGWGPKRTGFADRVETGVLPPVPLPFPVETLEGQDFIALRLHAEDVSGVIRLTVLHSHPQVRAEMIVSSTGKMEGATAEGGPVTTWTTEEVADGDDLLLPGYARTDGGSLTIPVDGPYLGLFAPLDEPGRMVAPNGTMYEGHTFRGGAKWLLDPAPGDWRLELDETNEVDAAPDRLFFAGASFPALGIVPPPPGTCPDDPFC